MSRIFKLALTSLAFAVLSLASANTARADSVGYTFQLSGDSNVPTMRLTNNSTLASITSFTITIGNTTRNFDYAGTEVAGGITYNLLSPDSVDNGVRSDFVQYTFGNFSPGLAFQFVADIDMDSSNSTENYRTVLFDVNGSDSSDNSLLTVVFSNGLTLSGNLPDFPANTANIFTFSQSQDITPSPNAVPEPATMLLLGTGLAGIAAKKVRRRKKA